MSTSTVSTNFSFLVIFLFGCGAPIKLNTPTQASQPEVTIQGSILRSEVQTFEINNCTGKADAKRVESRSQSVNVTISAEIAAKLGASAEIISTEVQMSVGASKSNERGKSTSIELVAPPNTRMIFELEWIGNERSGVVQNIHGSTIPIAFRDFSPIDVRIKSQQDIGCPGFNQPKPIITTTALSAKTTLAASTPTVRPLPVSTNTPPISQKPFQFCTIGFASGETRVANAGTWVIGDVEINGTIQYDLNEADAKKGYPEGTAVYFETSGTVKAPYGAACATGSLQDTNLVVQTELQKGCGSGCRSVRVVILRSNGKQDSEYYSR